MTSALRKKLLSLAIRGKLVPQDAADEPASVLLERIRAERESKENAAPRRGRGRRSSSDNPPCPKRGTSAGTASAEGTAFDPPFPIPESWAWTTLDNIAETITDGDHQPPPKASSGIPFLVISNIVSGNISFKNTRYVSNEYFQSIPAFKRPRKGDILLSVTGSYGIPVLVENARDFCFQRHIALIRSNWVEKEFLLHYLKSHDAKKYFDSVATGTAQKTVSLERLREMWVPLPPLAEQRRIVSRFDALSSLSDSIDEDSAAFGALAGTAKSRILDLAIRGALVPQDPTDEPASVLLDRIRSTADKPPCPKKGKKREATIGDVLDPPFLIPESWAWTTLGDVAELVLGGTPDTHDSKCWGGDIPWLTPGEMSDIKGKYVSDTRRKLTRTGLEKASRMFPSRSVILSTRAPIGYLFINTVPMCTNQGCKTIVPKCGVLAEYLYYNLLGRVPELQSLGTGTTFKELSSGKLASLPLSLPPLAEQRRIVAKVDEMFATIDGMLG